MSSKVLQKSFFQKDTRELAQDLLGVHLVHEDESGKTAGKIVETEAYLEDDPAAHTYNGKTENNRAMFGPPGHSYVYFIYGMYHCFNCTSNEEGVGEAVLIRALEPVSGFELMKQRREVEDEKNLCSGPGKLTMAMDITKDHYGLDLTSEESKLRLERPETEVVFDIKQTERVGISKATELPYRFYIQENPHVSKK